MAYKIGDRMQNIFLPPVIDEYVGPDDPVRVYDAFVDALDFKALGIYTIVIVGYPSKDLVYWTDRLDPHSDELYVITEDGSYGVKGPVKHTFKAVCQHVADLDQILAVGPLGLLKACSDIARNHELSIRLNLGAVVGCFSEGLQKMKVGGKSKLTCPPEIAYGDRGSPPLIRPGATLQFEIELLEIVPSTPPPPAP